LSACVTSSVSKDCKWEVNAAPRSQIGEAAPLAGARNGRAITEQNRFEFLSAQAAEAAGFRPAHNCP